MNRRRFVAAALGAGVHCVSRGVAFAATGDDAGAPAGFDATSGYKLVENWDFRSDLRTPSALRAAFHTRYVYENGTLDHLNDEWTRYRDENNHVFVPEGLALVARAASLRPGQITSGMLRSRGARQYGVFECRLKVPRGRGTWPAFWLNPQDARWPPEIDIVEIVNNGRDDTRQSFHFLHGRDTDKAPERFSKLGPNRIYRPGFDYADGFHVFAVEWTPAAVRHFVDGELIHDQAFRWVHDDGSDAGPAHVLLNLAVGGHWPGPPDASTFPASLVVEYIRVWQR